MGEFMTYEELIAKASKGPFEWLQTGKVNSNLDVVLTGSAHDDIGWTYKPEDAQLIAHTLNHYEEASRKAMHFDKVLEALEVAIEYMPDDSIRYWGTDEVIKEAQEVQV